MPQFFDLIVVGKIKGPQWPRPHQAHVAHQYIEELRNLIQRGFSYQPPHFGDPLIIGEQISIIILFVVHGLELKDIEYFFVFSWPILPKKRIALKVDP